MRVLKFNVPVDDKPHLIGAGKICLVACQHVYDSVQVWVEGPVMGERLVRVFGTGHRVPDDAIHLGSALTSTFCWHVFEVKP